MNYFNQNKNKVLIVVPLLSLLKQLPVEFTNYNNGESLDFGVYGESSITNPDADYIFATWQSIVGKSTEWFSQFGAVIGDEAHKFTAKSLVKILSNLEFCKHRVSLTGTLDETFVNELTLIGLFGPKVEMITTREMIDLGISSDIIINALILKYDESSRSHVSKLKTYAEEIDWLINDSKRNKFIKNLALKVKGNTILMFKNRAHGKILLESLKDSKKPVLYVDGTINNTLREKIRQQIEDYDDLILIGSSGVFATGVSANKIHNIIRAHPMKGRVQNFQSIGRGLRLHETKTYVNRDDIIDDLVHKKKVNFSMKHGAIRIKAFTEQKLDYKIFNIEVK